MWRSSDWVVVIDDDHNAAAIGMGKEGGGAAWYQAAYLPYWHTDVFVRLSGPRYTFTR